MERPIVTFGQDDEGVPLAWLSCGHTQHVRHNPPFVNRAWILTEEGRARMLGQPLNCVRCDALELPDHFVPYDKTDLLTEAAFTAGSDISQPAPQGIWLRIIVLDGRLRLRIPYLSVDLELSSAQSGTIAPEMTYALERVGSVQFFQEFYCSRQQYLAWVRDILSDQPDLEEHGTSE